MAVHVQRANLESTRVQVGIHLAKNVQRCILQGASQTHMPTKTQLDAYNLSRQSTLLLLTDKFTYAEVVLYSILDAAPTPSGLQTKGP